MIKSFGIGVALGMAILAAAVLGSNCTHVKPVVDAGKHCAVAAGSETLKNVLPKVNEVLGCSIAAPVAIPACVLDGITELGVQFGRDLVLCALEQIANAKFAAPGDTDAGVKQRRAAAYLEQHGSP